MDDAFFADTGVPARMRRYRRAMGEVMSYLCDFDGKHPPQVQAAGITDCLNLTFDLAVFSSMDSDHMPATCALNIANTLYQQNVFVRWIQIPSVIGIKRYDKLIPEEVPGVRLPDLVVFSTLDANCGLAKLDLVRDLIDAYPIPKILVAAGATPRAICQNVLYRLPDRLGFFHASV